MSEVSDVTTLLVSFYDEVDEDEKQTPTVCCLCSLSLGFSLRSIEIAGE